MNEITIKFADLLEIVRAMEEDDIDTVTLSLFEPFDDDGETVPARIEFEGATADNPNVSIFYDDAEAVDSAEPGITISSSTR